MVEMRSVGTGVVMRSAGVERQGGALAEVIVTIRSHSAEHIRGPARDSFGLARKRGLGWTQRQVPHYVRRSRTDAEVAMSASSGGGKGRRVEG